MSRILAFIIINLFVVNLYSQTAIKQIHNWSKLTATQQTNALSYVLSIFEEEVKTGVLDEFKMPLSMTYYSYDFDDEYIHMYPNNKTGLSAVGYVPVQFVESYETELQKFYKNKGDLDKVVRLEVLLAIHYTESTFIPTRQTPAYGLGQLTLGTAVDLLDRKENTYDDFFSVVNKKVVFNAPTVQNQIGLTITLLHDEKGYDRNSSEKSAIRNYRGSGKVAQDYATMILTRTKTYMEMMNKGEEIDPKQFLSEAKKAEIKEPVIKQVEIKGYGSITDEEYELALKDAMDIWEKENPSLENKEDVKVPANNYELLKPIPRGQCEYYVEIANGRTLFSYFLNIRSMVSVICDQKNEKFSLFYKSSSGKKIVIKSLDDLDPKNNNIQTNVKAGDIIYLPVGTVIKGDDETLRSVLKEKKCPQWQN
jgi:hypothetical protein